MRSWQTLRIRADTDAVGVGSLEKPPISALSIVAMVGGACRLESRKGAVWRRATFTSGDVGITVPGRQIHIRWRKLAATPLRTVHIDLPPSVFDPGADLARLDVLSRPDPVIAAMATAIVEAKAAGADEVYEQSAAQFLAAHLLAPAEIRTPARHALTDRQMTTVVDYMRANLTERITLDDLAAQVSLSRFHFLRLFAATAGRSPAKYLTELRITEARRRLMAGDEPVATVGRRAGFPSASHFSAIFHRYVGCSPSEYRLRAR